MLSAVRTLRPSKTVRPKNTTALSRTHAVCIVWLGYGLCLAVPTRSALLRCTDGVARRVLLLHRTFTFHTRSKIHANPVGQQYPQTNTAQSKRIYSTVHRIRPHACNQQTVASADPTLHEGANNQTIVVKSWCVQHRSG